MEVDEIVVPDTLWRQRSISEGAKLLWCYLRASAPERQFTFNHLRQATGLCQNSLLKHLAELVQANWLRWTRTDLRTIEAEAVGVRGGDALKLPTELVFDRRLPRPAKWMWGVIRRLKGAFDYQLLRTLTGYGHCTLSRSVQAMRETGWLVPLNPKARSRTRPLKTSNPFEAERQAELAELSRGIELAKRQQGYSVGQYLVARMVQVLSPDTLVIENAEVTGLDNILTGGRMHYDLFMPQHKLAVEFHGRQHDGPTDRFPSVEEFQAQRLRDLVKAGISWERGIDLVVVRPADLSSTRLRTLLEARIGLKEVPATKRHLLRFLDLAAARYRRKAAPA